MEFVNHTLNVIESRSQVDTIYTDIRKAFDRIRHSCLLKKLQELGFDQNLVDWIRVASHLLIERISEAIPVLIGPQIPRKDRELTRERYCRGILTLFKP